MNDFNSQFDDSVYEEPFIGMPVMNLNYAHTEARSACDSVDRCPLAMAYVPWQCWSDTYAPSVALQRGTIFPELDLPWEVRNNGY